MALTPHIDPNTLLGSAAPQLWRILDADPNAYAVGDVVVDSLQTISGAPAVRLWGGAAFAGIYGQPARQASLLSSTTNDFGLVVGVAPSAPFAPGQSIVAAGGGSNRFVWVIRAAGLCFDVYGDLQQPSRGEFEPLGQALGVTAQGLQSGGVTATLAYAPPAAGQSGTQLNGASFRTDGQGELAIVGLAPGVALAPGALYRVHLRYSPKPYIPGTGQALSDGL